MSDNKQRYEDALHRLTSALTDVEIIRDAINAKRLELANLDHLKNLKQNQLSDLNEQIKQRQSELEWSGTKQEYIIRQLRAAIQTVTWEKPHYGQRHVGKWYNDRFEAVVTRTINRRVDDLLTISRMRLPNGQINEYSRLAKETRQRLAHELRRARTRLRELKTAKVQRWLEVESSERLLESVKKSFAPVPPPLMDVDQMVKNGVVVPNEPGIYFLWQGGLVAYVGQTTNLSRRLITHERLQPDDKISYLCIDSSELFYQEAFYIGVCRPWRNGGASPTAPKSTVFKREFGLIAPRVGNEIAGSNDA